VSISDSEDIPANVPIKLKPATENNRTSNGPCISIAGAVLWSQIHEILFRILYHQPVSFLDLDLPAEQLLLKLMDLTRVYDCLNHVKAQLTAEIYTGDCFEREEIAKHPAVFLNIANRLQNKRLFQEALQHAVGQTLKHNKDWDSLDKDVEEIVNECVDGLASRVKKACVSLYSVRMVPASLPDFVACSIFREFLLTHLATKRVASGEMFDTFRYLHKLVSGTELLETMELGWLVESAATIRSGAHEAISFIEDQDDDSDRDWMQHRQSTLDGLYNVQHLGFTPDRIKTVLKNLVTGAQKEIRPLMEAGADYGYFTCIDFKCLYPWEEDISESLEAE
jgi:hypothetical protein